MKHKSLSTIRFRINSCCQTECQFWSKGSRAATPTGDRYQIVLLSIKGMYFGVRIENLRQRLKRIYGVFSAHAVFAGSAVKVRFDPALTDIQAIAAALKTEDYYTLHGCSPFKPVGQNPTSELVYLH